MKAWIKPNMCLYVSHMIDLSLLFDYVGYCPMIGFINSLSFALFVSLSKFYVNDLTVFTEENERGAAEQFSLSSLIQPILSNIF